MLLSQATVHANDFLGKALLELCPAKNWATQEGQVFAFKNKMARGKS
jgi:hypothetical protein